MSLLTIVQAAAVRVGLTSPSIAASSTDQNIQQLVQLVNEDGQELADRPNWQELTIESTFLTVATESQGSILTLAGADFAFILNNTIWNRTQQRPIFGPKSPAEWQQLKAQLVQGPWQQYVIRGNLMRFTPAPPAGQTCAFDWVTKFWATDSTGVTGKSAMTSDTDVSKLNERLHVLGAIWRWKAAKKLDYGQDYQKYEDAVQQTIGRDASKATLNLGGGDTTIPPVVVVSAGSWPISGQP